MLNFTIVEPPLPASYVFYFGFQTQRVNTFSGTTPYTSILDEEVFLTIANADPVTQNQTVIGSLNAKITYPDKGQADISSEGQTVYPVYLATGILSDVAQVRIVFNADLSRNVTLLG